MKSLLIFLTLLSFTAVATSAAVSSASESNPVKESSVEIDSLKAAALQFLGTATDTETTSGILDKLIAGVQSGESMNAVSALKSLSKMDFSKEQLKSYGALLGEFLPSLLASNFDLENGELGKYIGKAIAFFESEDFASAAEMISNALKYVDTDSLQNDLLNGIVESYAPMLKGVDVGQAMELGKSLLGKSGK